VAGAKRRRIVVVGAGTRFLSGVSYYTLRLANALVAHHDTTAILMRQMLPTRMYPGRDRVGSLLTTQRYAPAVRVFDGIDWYWFPSIIRAAILLLRSRPQVVLFQWWTGTVLHTYLALAVVARLAGARVVIEFHEVLDTAEARMPAVDRYVRLLGPLLTRLADGFVIHSNADRDALRRRFRLNKRPITVIPHGPFDHHRPGALPLSPLRAAPSHATNLLYFGVIRPFKGVEDLIRAYDSLSPDEVRHLWLTVVGETWEGWELPGQLIARSPYRDRITFVNRYVSDEELAAALAGADVVVLPYHRSSASGPLHTAMSWGLPVIVSEVGGLVEAASGYDGVIFVPPRDPVALGRAFQRAASLGSGGRRFADPHSWENTVSLYEDLVSRLLGELPSRGP
jgi:glycosyltransferase involved in cell wall biosynthesis